MSRDARSRLAIVTGASRGMGLAMAEQLLDTGCTVLTMARHPEPRLVARAERAGAQLVQWSVDLAEAVPVAHALGQWLAGFAPEHFASASLINNAGVIPAVVPLRDADPAELASALRVGLEAAMLLTAAFLGASRAWTGQRRVLNISSGLGRRPMASQAAYCAAKAGMDLFTRCVALDEAQEPNGARVCALAPGVIDTDMQVQLRGAAAASFPDRGRFEQLHSRRLLASPAQAARDVLAFLEHADFGAEPVADVRDRAG